jgi:hypothetical protein
VSTFLEQVVAQATVALSPQPNANGEFASPLDGALFMALRYGIPQTPLKDKAPFLQNWPAKASVDPAQIRAWAAEYPGCNFGSVAVRDQHFVFEADKPADGMPTVRERFKQQGHDFTAKLIIESSPGKGHRYYLSAPGIENIGQNAVKYGDFSVRADGEQCVSPGSLHPQTGRQYRVAVHNGPLTPPTAEEILFWNSERVESQKAVPISQNEPIPSGKRNSTITSILGRARQQNALEYDALLALARQHNQRCTPPLPESELETIARSISGYAVKPGGEGSVLLGGQVVGQPSIAPVNLVLETEPINPQEITTTGLDYLPERVLTSERLQDIYMDYFQSNDWPLSLALPALVTAASVVVPQPAYRSNLLIGGDDDMTSLYTALIADVGAGKTAVARWAMQAIGIYEPPTGSHYYAAKSGSAEQLVKHLAKKQQTFTNKSVLVDPDEWAHLFSKAAIPDASFPTVLTTSFYKRNQVFTVGGVGGGREYSLDLAMSFIGGIIEDDFDTVFGAASLGGLYDRFLFGRAPDNYHWNFRQCPIPPGKHFDTWNLKSVQVDPSVFEVTKSWAKENPPLGLTRIPEVVVRIARIYACLDGRPEITGKDMEPLHPLALYQLGLRKAFKPNPGLNPDAVYANRVLAWVAKYAGEWTSIAKLKQHMWRLEEKLGPQVAFRSLIGLGRAGRIQLWLADQSQLPSDYHGPKPRIGLVRRVR